MPRVLFERPPVFEVVLSVQLDGRLPFKAFDGPTIHSAFKDDFPDVVEQPVLEPVVFPNRPIISFESSLPRVRWWFVSANGHKLIQVQDDRFTFNWRGLEAPLNDSYPGYDRLKSDFFEGLNAFKTVVSENGFGNASVNACQLSYINLILLNPSADERKRIKEHVTFMGFPENHFIRALNMNWIHDVKESDDAITEFYKTTAILGSSPNESPALHLHIEGTAVLAGNLSDHFDALHENIHNYFLELTTSQMHDRWERK